MNNCPKCGGLCDRESVDVGVGVIHGPYGCLDCGWSEYLEYDSSEGTCLEEQKNPDYYYDSRGGVYPRKIIKKNHYDY